jgi:signal transduction histidine kinase
MLGQVFGNVLENACKYGEAGTPITVNVTALPVDEAIPPMRREATITIENYGFGLSPADLSQVFQPFFRSQQARLTGVSGVGLGLSIAKRLIEFLGGRIEVTSCERGATRFSIVIPCIGDGQPAGAPLEPADAVAPASLHWKQAACDNFGNL